jgi:hypothetical protein
MKDDDAMIEGKLHPGTRSSQVSYNVLSVDWNFPASHKDLADILEGFHPSIQALMM